MWVRIHAIAVFLLLILCRPFLCSSLPLLLLLGSNILQSLHAHLADTQNAYIASLSRSGRPPAHLLNTPLRTHTHYLQADLCLPSSLSPILARQNGRPAYDAVISCVGGFGDVQHMRAINGAANCSLIRASHAAGIPRFIYISAHPYRLPRFLQQGYFEGKKMAEQCLLDVFGPAGYILRPSFIYGTRHVSIHGHTVPLPLWIPGLLHAKLSRLKVGGRPLYRYATRDAQLAHLPFGLGALVHDVSMPSVSVHAVSEAVSYCVLEEEPARNVMEVEDILEFEK